MEALCRRRASPLFQVLITCPIGELKIDVTLARSAGDWSGTIDIPAQSALALPLGKVVVDGSAVSFTLPGLPGEPAFTGTLAQDGTAISGTFAQAGQTFPFKLLRKADPTSSAASALDGFDQFVESAMKAGACPVLPSRSSRTAGWWWRRDTECEKPVELKVIQPNGVFTLTKVSR